MLLSAGPITLAPGAAQEVVLAVIVAPGANRLNSVSLLKDFDQAIQTAFDANALNLLGVPRPGSARLSLERPWPNPGRGSFTLGVFTRGRGRGIRGTGRPRGPARARTLSRGSGPGTHTVALGPAGEQLAAGMYFVKLVQGRASVSGRVVVLQ